jgi:hypothetical protein
LFKLPSVWSFVIAVWADINTGVVARRWVFQKECQIWCYPLTLLDPSFCCCACSQALPCTCSALESPGSWQAPYQSSLSSQGPASLPFHKSTQILDVSCQKSHWAYPILLAPATLTSQTALLVWGSV